MQAVSASSRCARRLRLQLWHELPRPCRHQAQRTALRRTHDRRPNAEVSIAAAPTVDTSCRIAPRRTALAYADGAAAASLMQPTATAVHLPSCSDNAHHDSPRAPGCLSIASAGSGTDTGAGASMRLAASSSVTIGVSGASSTSGSWHGPGHGHGSSCTSSSRRPSRGTAHGCSWGPMGAPGRGWRALCAGVGHGDEGHACGTEHELEARRQQLRSWVSAQQRLQRRKRRALAAEAAEAAKAEELRAWAELVVANLWQIAPGPRPLVQILAACVQPRAPSRRRASSPRRPSRGRHSCRTV